MKYWTVHLKSNNRTKLHEDFDTKAEAFGYYDKAYKAFLALGKNTTLEFLYTSNSGSVESIDKIEK